MLHQPAAGCFAQLAPDTPARAPQSPLMHTCCSHVQGNAFNAEEALQGLEELRKGLLEYHACLLIHLLSEQAPPERERTSLYALFASLDLDVPAGDAVPAGMPTAELNGGDESSDDHWVWAVEQLRLSQAQVRVLVVE